ncbi:hypothetical protein AC629_08655 [Bradyrhizobium sp. NAS80.1]|uniref:hypothetical protein n=1 Tax=Bradyrhizobium sp. NAS80.1 TaxID=1680159 RepID=UPI0009604E2B|nr:hypothetical protein [Bradyrhizobium sp. NAS80.1]OKO88673.1 hypothetical protein AC629_08655 [Bradyrhizobium sp. NAS80.1]
MTKVFLTVEIPILDLPHVPSTVGKPALAAIDTIANISRLARELKQSIAQAGRGTVPSRAGAKILVDCTWITVASPLTQSRSMSWW